MAPKQPSLVILVGGNGSGKSTYYEAFLKKTGLPFVNADEIAKSLYPGNEEAKSSDAALVAEDMRTRLLDQRKSFIFETVFSHVSKVDFIAKAKAMGYSIKMFAIYTNDVQLNVARVAQRVDGGGHSVPEDRICTRIPRTYKHIGLALPLCDQFVLLDNSYETPFILRLSIKGGQVVDRNEPLPDFIVEPLKSLGL